MIFFFPFFPEQASTSALRVDHLYFFLLAVCSFIALLIIVLIVYFGIKYRRGSSANRSHAATTSIKLEAFWTTALLVIAIVMFVWGASVYFTNSTPPKGAIQIYVVGKQWMWKVQYPGGQQEINTLHVPMGHPVKLTMTSQDAIHSFFIPAFRVKQDVLPDRYTTEWFKAIKPGEYHLFCAEYCGTEHSGMIGKVVVMKPADYEAWLSGGTTGRAVTGTTVPAESMAAAGEKLFNQLGCVACHGQEATVHAPKLSGMFGQTVRLENGQTVVADENYIRESILNPTTKVVAGFQPIMPSFKGQVSQEQLLQLIAHIKSLGQREKPRGRPEAE